MTNEERIQRQNRYAAWIADERTQEVFAAVRDSALLGLKQARYNDMESVLFFKTLLGVIDEFESYAQQAISDGQVARAEIEEARKRDETFRRYPHLREMSI